MAYLSNPASRDLHAGLSTRNEGVCKNAVSPPTEVKRADAGPDSYPVAHIVPSGLTLELSRPAAGWRTRASVAQARGRRHDAGSA